MKTALTRNLLAQPLVANKRLAIVVIGAVVLLVAINSAYVVLASEQVGRLPWAFLRDLLNALLINVLAAYLVYVLVVYLPGARKRALVRTNLATHYRRFREDLVTHFLLLSEKGADYDRIRALREMHAFRDFFKEDNCARWYAVANALSDNPHVMRDIATGLVLFRNELAYALSQIEIQDERVFGLLKRLSSAIYRTEQRNLEYEDIKAFMGFMWDILAGWSIVDGYRDKDIVQEAIEQL
jgi:hypothetical protein